MAQVSRAVPRDGDVARGLLRRARHPAVRRVRLRPHGGAWACSIQRFPRARSARDTWLQYGAQHAHAATRCSMAHGASRARGPSRRSRHACFRARARARSRPSHADGELCHSRMDAMGDKRNGLCGLASGHRTRRCAFQKVHVGPAECGHGRTHTRIPASPARPAGGRVRAHALFFQCTSAATSCLPAPLPTKRNAFSCIFTLVAVPLRLKYPMRRGMPHDKEFMSVLHAARVKWWLWFVSPGHASPGAHDRA